MRVSFNLIREAFAALDHLVVRRGEPHSVRPGPEMLTLADFNARDSPGYLLRAVKGLTSTSRALHSNALEYAALTDNYRVRIEAGAALARIMLDSGEYDAALKHASDVLAVACRFGHTLRKTSLRVHIGEILIQRDDPRSGLALLERALNLSTRIGYQRIVERVQSARARPTTGIFHSGAAR